jgi:ankyrin repeat protein
MPCVEQLLAAGCTAAAINELDGTSALHDAAAGGYLAVVQLLLSKAPALLPVQVGVRRWVWGRAPLYLLWWCGAPTTARSLACAAAPRAQDCDGDTALHNAARGGHLHVVQFLLEQGADESTLNSSGKTPAGEAEEPEVVAALVAAAAQRQRASGGGGGVAPAGGTSPGQQQQQQQPSDQPT